MRQSLKKYRYFQYFCHIELSFFIMVRGKGVILLVWQNFRYGARPGSRLRSKSISNIDLHTRQVLKKRKRKEEPSFCYNGVCTYTVQWWAKPGQVVHEGRIKAHELEVIFIQSRAHIWRSSTNRFQRFVDLRHFDLRSSIQCSTCTVT